MNTARLACVLLLISCATHRNTAEGTTAFGTSKYSVGDCVTYLYTGSFTPAPVELTERVEEKHGNRLHIAVTARRGNEVRRWLQVVTDTPENQKAEKIDELYRLDGTARVRLANQDNQDVYEMYQWVVFSPQGRATGVTHGRSAFNIGDATFDCDHEHGVFVSPAGRRVFEFATCPDFVWTNGPAEIVDEETTEIIWRREVARVSCD